MGEERSVAVAIVHAIDAGIDAQERSRRASPPEIRRRWFDMLSPARMVQWLVSSAELSPPAEVVHGAARVLDEFATELHAVQRLVGDLRLEPIVMRSGKWGERVWRDTAEAPLVFAEIEAALDLLREYQTNLASGRTALDGGDGAHRG